MKKYKFRFWSPQGKAFVQQYKYNGLVDKLFEYDKFLKPQQFIGIFDRNMCEIYENDVVKYFTLDGEKLGVVEYRPDRCAYFLGWDDAICNLNIETFEVVGTMNKDYHYNDNGELTKNTNIEI